MSEHTPHPEPGTPPVEVQLLGNLYHRYAGVNTPNSPVLLKVVEAAHEGGVGADFYAQVAQSMTSFPQVIVCSMLAA